MYKSITLCCAALALTVAGSTQAQISGSFGSAPPPEWSGPLALEEAQSAPMTQAKLEAAASLITPDANLDASFLADPKEGFGDQNSYSWIDARDFVRYTGGTNLSYWAYEYFNPPTSGNYRAPLTAPIGVDVKSVICNYGVTDGATDSLRFVWKEVTGGLGDTSPTQELLADETTVTHPSGPFYFALALSPSTPVTMTYGQLVLFFPVVHKHYIEVTMTPSTRITGCWVNWQRQISPAPANATFSDVPTSSSYFQAVEALNASGITSGCGGGKFCPTQPVTRQQMAVFLAKALGLHYPK